MKKFLNDLISRKQGEITAMRKQANESQDINEVRSLGERIAAAQQEIEEARAKLAECNTGLGNVRAEMGEENEPENGEEDDEEQPAPDNNTRSRNFRPGRVMGSFDTRSNAPQTRNNMEKRAKTLAATNRMTAHADETRAILMSGGMIATPTEVGEMQDAFTQVSSIVDMVHIEDCTGMGAYEVPYEITSATAAKHTEGEEVAESDPQYGYVTIAPETAAVTSYVSRKVRKLTPVRYLDRVQRSTMMALRKYASGFIISKIKASELTLKKTLTAIDATTVRTIALAYGGDEGIEGNAVMVLNKATLTKLGDIRGTQEKKAVYEITQSTSNPNVGTIKDGGTIVQYCLNKNLADNEIIYGNMKCFEMALFGDYEIIVSEDAKVTKLMLTIVGDAEIGGEVVVQDGFIHATVGA